MPITLNTLFTSPQDVYDYLSVEGVELREDDSNLASGQIIQTTSDTPIGSTTMAVAALPVALLAGAQLTFLQAGMLVPITVQLTAVANIGATSLAIVLTTVDVPSGAQARDSGVNAATGARLVVACQRGTSKVKLYCNGRYDDSQLKLCGSVLNWATIIAGRFLATRRVQGCPKSVDEDYKEAVKEMQSVSAGQIMLEDAGTRGVDWPWISNVTVDPGYDVMRARIEPNISEQTPTAYGQYVDWNSAMWLEY